MSGTTDTSVRVTPSDIELVHRLVRDREALQPGFTIAWRTISRADPAFQRAWAAATLELSRVNAGIACIEAFWRLEPPDPASGIAAADLCRDAGARAALACLRALPIATRYVGAAGLPLWWHAMTLLAQETSALVAPVAGRLPYLLVNGDAAAFVDFVTAGLKATTTDKRRRTAFFVGTDPLAEAFLARRSGTIGYAESERMLTAFVAGLWGGIPRLRAFPLASPDALTRTVIASGAVILPATYPGIPPGRTGALYRAAAAHALLDPAYEDPNRFVAKGRALFAAADRHDPASSRDIGSLLGNDLGQMRVQFNARTYVVEPAYRDDNMHLWDLPEIPNDSLALSVDTALSAPDPDWAPRARDAGPDDRAAILATYPEWDTAARILRPDWTTVRDTIPVRRLVSDAAEPRLRADLTRLVRSVSIGRRRRPPQEDGEEFDLDRAIAAIAATRMGVAPDPRLYRDHTPIGRDLATLLILDTSQSTTARASTGLTILDAQHRAVAAFGEALHTCGDRFALRSFASAGRDDVRVTRLKDFDEPLGPVVRERLAGLQAGLSTRLGAALRHAAAEIAPQPTARKLVLVLTDGEPSDIDVIDPAELVEDARRAVLDLRRRGIDVYGIVMDPADAGSGPAIFGRHNTMLIRRFDDLTGFLTGMYFRLAHR